MRLGGRSRAVKEIVVVFGKGAREGVDTIMMRRLSSARENVVCHDWVVWKGGGGNTLIPACVEQEGAVDKHVVGKCTV